MTTITSYPVGVIGCTGTVGQKLILLLCEHPWFRLTALAAGPNSAGKTYQEAVGSRWVQDAPIPASVRDMPVLCAESTVDRLAARCRAVFCAVSLPKEQVRALEEALARRGCAVISNNSACRLLPDVPMVIPEINPGHLAVLSAQRRRLGTDTGLIVCKSNCSIQSYMPPLDALRELGPEEVRVVTMQAASGAGRRPEDWPALRDNVLPYIAGEEEKSEQEPLKIWGTLREDAIVPAEAPVIRAQCLRVPVSDGHLAAVYVRYRQRASLEELKLRMAEYEGLPQQLRLPSAPQRMIRVFDEPDRPQPVLDRTYERGMGVTVGRMKLCGDRAAQFVCLSHNTLRGAAGGGVLLAELLAAQGYLKGGCA